MDPVSQSQIQEMNQKLNQTKLNLQEYQEKEAQRNNIIIIIIQEKIYVAFSPSELQGQYNNLQDPRVMQTVVRKER